MSHSFDLPFEAMRYTAWNTWKNSRQSFRNIYYHGGEIPQTPQVKFGQEVARALEEDPLIPGSETEITVTLRTTGNKYLTVQGHLDAFDEERCRVIEYKSGHLMPNGKDRWDDFKVRRHKQLDFYSLIAKEQYGHVDPEVELIWLETEWVTPSIEFDGHILESRDKRELRLTGREERFTRRIPEWQRRNLKKDLFTVAAEIEADYQNYLDTHE